MNWLPEHKCGLYLTHNEHRDSYEGVEEWIVDQETFGGQSRFDWTSPEEREKAIRDDSVWVLQWYPNTPVGFNCIAASSLDALAAYFAPDNLEDSDE
jgi:hypothetical protein